MLRVIKTVFPLRTCSNAFFKGRSRPCMEHEIGRCTAPCVGLITRERYLADVEEVVLFLRGKNQELLRSLHARMEAASTARHYELAARFRDQIRAVEKVFEKQKAQDWDLGDLDVFACAREGGLVLVQELLVRDGRIVSSHCHSFRTAIEDQEVMASFLAQFYLTERYVPPLVLCNVDFPERLLLQEWLRDKRGIKVEIAVPERGDKAKLVDLARKNALNAFVVERSQEERLEQLLVSLQSKLGMARAPRRIECFDISNFQGSLAVGSMVTFEDGRPARDRYRKFKIQTVVGADDFRCLQEVLERRLRAGLEANDLPDLLLIDGGKGQLGVAVELLGKLSLQAQVKVASIAKERRSRGTTERIFVPGNPSPLDLPQDCAESLYLQRIRDEAHRFAVKYHRELRRRATLRSGLEEIPGIGKKRQAALLDRFGTLKGLEAASPADLETVVGKALARVVYDRLGRGRSGAPGEGAAAP
jgi:excinuclease ABC subunit C